jgi:DNA processing protein
MPAADELNSWLALIRCPASGGIRFKQALEYAGSAQALLEFSTAQLKPFNLSQTALDYLSHPDWSAINQDLQWLNGDGHFLITKQDSRYPQLLKEIPDAPIALFVAGNPDVLDLPQIAIIGSRNPSPAGITTARAFAKALAQPGLAITSGLAMGIDEMGHRGALDVDGITIAVTATGLDQVYPAKHLALAKAITEKGALVSEFPINTPPKRYHFPKRNRIIAGLSLGTLVVEAASQSGSLITARLATEYGREIFAIPGSIHSPLARGCNDLIKQGAKLVETAHDIAEEFSHYQLPVTAIPEQSNIDLAEDQQMLLKLVDYSPTTIDMLVERSGLRAEAIASTLLILELNNQVTSSSGGIYTRCG